VVTSSKPSRTREDFWLFNPSGTFVVLTNHKSIVTGTDEGVWRRMRASPWDRSTGAAWLELWRRASS
jgi:phage/plasmid-associated DNA primase